MVHIKTWIKPKHREWRTERSVLRSLRGLCESKLTGDCTDGDCMVDGHTQTHTSEPELLSRLCCCPSTSRLLTALKISRHRSLNVCLYLAFRQPPVTVFECRSWAKRWKHFQLLCSDDSPHQQQLLHHEQGKRDEKHVPFETTKKVECLHSCFYSRLIFVPSVLLLMCLYCSVIWHSCYSKIKLHLS